MREIEPDQRYQVRAVGRALDLLFALSESNVPQDLTSLARRTGLHPSTAFRLLESLRAKALIRAGRDGYRLGARVFELGSAYLRTVSVWADAPGLAERLASQANETASIGVLDDGQVLYIAIAHGQRELGIQSFPGTRHPAHATALGKAMLAELPWSDVEAILDEHPPVRLTPHTRTDRAALREELERVAAQGYAVDDEGRAPGVFCVGAPIRDHTNAVVAAISISGPTFRMHEHGLDWLVGQVRDAARDASDLLGAPAPSSAIAG